MFALFDLAPTYAIDRDELERRYLERSRAVHPDRVATGTAAQRIDSLQQSMALNEAYKTLRKPVARAEYLLECHGVTIGGNEAVDQALLVEVLAAREQLAEAKLAGDDAQLAALERQMSARRQAALAQLAASWRAFESSRDPGDLAPIKRTLIELRYLDRYLEQLEDEDD